MRGAGVRVPGIVAMLLLVSLALASRLALDAWHEQRLIAVHSARMAPELSRGALAVLRAAPAFTIREGEIIAYRHPRDPSHLVLVRVVEARPAGSGRSTGRLLRLEGGGAEQAELWDVELHGTVLRVAGSVPHAGWVTIIGASAPNGSALAAPGWRVIVAALAAPALAAGLVVLLRYKRRVVRKYSPAP